MQRKAIFVDVDGTLVDHHGNVPSSAVDAIRAARANGHLVFLSTGRSLPELWPGLLDIGFDGIIAGAGAYVSAGEEELAHLHLSDAEVAHVRRYFDRHGIDYLFEGAFGLFGTEGVREGAGHALATMFPDDDTRARAQSGFFCYLDRIQPVPDPLDTPVSKVLFLLSPGVTFDDVRAEFGDVFHVLASSVGVFGRGCGEMQLPWVHKASGIEAISAHLGIDRAHTIALGDSDNDIEMLRHAGVGIAMGSGRPHVKEIADEITSAPQDHGIHEAFLRHGLIGVAGDAPCVR